MAEDQSLETKFSVHEAVCAERWTETIIRIKRLEQFVIAVGAAIIGLLLKIAFHL
jgi:hypothetical protein